MFIIDLIEDNIIFVLLEFVVFINIPHLFYPSKVPLNLIVLKLIYNCPHFYIYLLLYCLCTPTSEFNVITYDYIVLNTSCSHASLFIWIYIIFFRSEIKANLKTIYTWQLLYYITYIFVYLFYWILTCLDMLP